MNGLFISGTDTNVGKTYIACLIAAELKSRGVNVIPRKPVESGCSYSTDGLIPSDASALKKAAQYSASLQQVCPFRFAQPVSPERAARLSKQSITIQQVTEACIKNTEEDKDFLLVEGAGGFYSPLCDDGLNADLAQALGLPILLITEDKIGCINQVLLTVEAMQNRNLQLHALVLNQLEEESETSMDNFEDLSRRLNIPIIRHACNSSKIDLKLLEALI